MNTASHQLAAVVDKAHSGRFNVRTCSCMAQVLSGAAEILSKHNEKKTINSQFGFFNAVNDVRKWMELNSRLGTKRIPRKALQNMWMKVNNALRQVAGTLDTQLSTASPTVIQEYWELDVMKQMDMRDLLCVVLWIEEESKSPILDADAENFINRFDTGNVSVFRVNASNLQNRLECYQTHLSSTKFDGRIRIVLGVKDPVTTLKTVLALPFLRQVPVMVNTSHVDDPEDIISELCRLKPDVHFSVKSNGFDKFCGFATVLWINYKDDPSRTIVEKKVSKTGVVIFKTDSMERGLKYMDNHGHLGYLDEFRIVIGDGEVKLDELAEAALHASKKKEYFNAARNSRRLTKDKGNEEEFSTLELVQVLRNRLKWHTPILIYSYDSQSINPELYCFKSLKCSSDMGVLEYFAMMKALPWAVDLAAFRSETNTQAAGVLRIVNLRCNDLVPKKSGTNIDPYVTIKIGDSFEKKTKKMTSTFNPTWNLGWEIPCKLSDKITLMVQDKSMFGKHDFEGIWEGQIVELIPVATPLVEVTKAIEYKSKSNGSSHSTNSPSHSNNHQCPGIISLDVGFRFNGQSERTIGLYFGQPLEHSINASIAQATPHLVDEMCAFLSVHGLETEGIFRQPVNPKRVEALKVMLDKGQEVDFTAEDVHDVAILLRAYLRELPDPVIPSTMYTAFKNAGTLEKKRDRVASIKTFLEKLPSANLDVFSAVTGLLQQISKNESMNKMPARNLAMALGPAMVIPKNLEAQPGTYLIETTVVTTMIETCILYYHKLFKNATPSPQRAHLPVKTVLNSADLTDSMSSSVATPRFKPNRSEAPSEVETDDNGRMRPATDLLRSDFSLKESQINPSVLASLLEEDPYAPLDDLELEEATIPIPLTLTTLHDSSLEESDDSLPEDKEVYPAHSAPKKNGSKGEASPLSPCPPEPGCSDEETSPDRSGSE